MTYLSKKLPFPSYHLCQFHFLHHLHKSFVVFPVQHHCRKCGRAVCAKCNKQTKKVPFLSSHLCQFHFLHHLHKSFVFFPIQHHCRKCGGAVCAKCNKQTKKVPFLSYHLCQFHFLPHLHKSIVVFPIQHHCQKCGRAVCAMCNKQTPPPQKKKINPKKPQKSHYFLAIMCASFIFCIICINLLLFFLFSTIVGSAVERSAPSAVRGGAVYQSWATSLKCAYVMSANRKSPMTSGYLFDSVLSIPFYFIFKIFLSYFFYYSIIFLFKFVIYFLFFKFIYFLTLWSLSSL